MKRIISLITSAALSAAMLSAMAVTSNAETTDLEILAASLGAETDHFSQTSLAYLKTDLESKVSYQNQGAYFDTQYAVSVLQTLVHNGKITPSDIKEGAATLSEIAPDEAVNELIWDYSHREGKDRTELYFGNIYCHTSQEDMAARLIEAAERAMKDGRYFVAAFKEENNELRSIRSTAFSVPVIGITDGSWTFDGKTYDKCLLTLDPSSSKEPDDSLEIQKVDYTNMGFQEDYCIYVDSKTGAFTVPARHECNDDYFDIYFVCDDDDILNYKGKLSPSEDFGSDTDDLCRIYVYDSSSLQYVIDEKYTGTREIPPEDMCENYIYYYDRNFVYYDSTDNLHIETIAGAGAFRGNSTYFGISMNYENNEVDFECDGVFVADISRNGLKLQKKPESFTTVKDWINEKNERFSYFIYPEPYIVDNVGFAGETKGSVELEILDDGFLIRNDGNLRAGLHKGSSNVSFITNESVMLRIDDSDGLMYIYRDGNGDESFSEKVQVGDTNCDGKIDARDASLILSAYADLSGNSASACYVSVRYGDFNGDGKLNSADASAVLCSYADMAAK